MMARRGRRGGSVGRVGALLPVALLILLPVLDALAASETENDGTFAADGGEGPPAQYDVGFNTGQYFNYSDVQGMLFNISEKYPSITKLYSLGKTYEGRDLWALKLSDHPDMQEQEPEVLYIGLHHAREWSSVQVVMYFLHYMVTNYGKPPTDDDRDGKFNEDPFNGEDDDGDGRIDEDAPESQATWLVDNRQLWFIPVFNPDGFDYCWDQYYNQGITDETVLWRKNREPNYNPVTGSPFPEYMAGQPMWGTDLNRNYGWHWGEVGYQGYVDPSREDYGGPWDTKDDDGDNRVAEDNMDGVDNDRDGRIDEDPRGGFTTFETKTLRDFMMEHNFTILMSYHTYKEQGTIYWPYMYTRQLPPDEPTFRRLAEGMFVFNGYEYRNYTGADQTRKGPWVDGDLNDYAYGALGILSYCIELRQPQFIPEPSALPQLEGENLGVNIFLAEAADAPLGCKLMIEHNPLKDTDSRGPYRVSMRLNATGEGLPPSLGEEPPCVHYSTDNGATWQTLKMSQGGDGRWHANIPGQRSGTRIKYYIEAKDTRNIRTFSPSYAPADVHSFLVGQNGVITGGALQWLYILMMVAGMALLVPGMGYAFYFLRRKDEHDFHRTVEVACIATGVLFIGGLPVGGAISYQEFGTPWMPAPLILGITGIRTLLAIAIMCGILLLARGSVAGYLNEGKARFCPMKGILKAGGRSSPSFDSWLKKERKDSLSREGFARAFMFLALVTLAVLLIPKIF